MIVNCRFFVKPLISLILTSILFFYVEWDSNVKYLISDQHLHNVHTLIIVIGGLYLIHGYTDVPPPPKAPVAAPPKAAAPQKKQQPVVTQKKQAAPQTQSAGKKQEESKVKPNTPRTVNEPKDGDWNVEMRETKKGRKK